MGQPRPPSGTAEPETPKKAELEAETETGARFSRLWARGGGGVGWGGVGWGGVGVGLGWVGGVGLGWVGWVGWGWVGWVGWVGVGQKLSCLVTSRATPTQPNPTDHVGESVSKGFGPPNVATAPFLVSLSSPSKRVALTPTNMAPRGAYKTKHDLPGALP